MNKKNCEFCGEEIHVNSRRCPFCAGVQKKMPSVNDGLNALIPDRPDNQLQEINSEKLDRQSESNEKKKQKYELDIRYTGPGINNYGERQTDVALSNRFKVFLSVFSSMIPGVGQIIGIISAIIFLSNEQDEDRKSFGKALLTASLVTFVVWCMCYMLVVAALIGSQVVNNS